VFFRMWRCEAVTQYGDTAGGSFLMRREGIDMEFSQAERARHMAHVARYVEWSAIKDCYRGRRPFDQRMIAAAERDKHLVADLRARVVLVGDLVIASIVERGEDEA